MTLWKLEVLRLWRTRRWLALVGTFGFFAILGPITARYLQQIISTVGDVAVELPPPSAAQAMAQYASNIAQLGVLVVVIVAASALAFDQRIEAAAFYRSRLPSVGPTLLPRWAVTAGAAAVTFIVATGLAWWLTAGLVAAPDPAATAIGALYGALYLAFVAAVTAIVAAFVRTVVATVFATVAVLVAVAAASFVASIEPWLPSELLGAVVELVGGTEATEFLPAAAITVVLTPALLMLAIVRLDRREL